MYRGDRNLFEPSAPDLPVPALRRFLAALDRLYGEPADVDGYAQVACTVLKALCEADAVSFSERDWSRTGRHAPLSGFRTIWSEPIRDYGAIMLNIAQVCEGGPAWTCDPKGKVLILGEFFSQPKLRDHAVYQEGLRYLGVRFNLNFGFTVQGRIDLQFGVSRGPMRDFTEAERVLAATIAPHLKRAYEMAVLRTWQQIGLRGVAENAALALTARQRDVLHWLLAGKSNSMIGEILGISAETVKIHRRRVYRALGVTTRVGAAWTAMRAVPGYLPVSGAADIGWDAAPRGSAPDALPRNGVGSA